jgi:hypothetical protein
MLISATFKPTKLGSVVTRLASRWNVICSLGSGYTSYSSWRGLELGVGLCSSVNKQEIEKEKGYEVFIFASNEPIILQTVINSLCSQSERPFGRVPDGSHACTCTLDHRETMPLCSTCQDASSSITLFKFTRSLSTESVLSIIVCKPSRDRTGCLERQRTQPTNHPQTGR